MNSDERSRNHQPTLPTGSVAVEVAGTAQLAGTLRVELPNQVGGPYVPKLGDIFPFLAASGGAGGTFDELDLPALSPGLAWQINPGNVTVFLNRRRCTCRRLQLQWHRRRRGFHRLARFLGKTGEGLAADGDHDLEVDEGDYRSLENPLWRNSRRRGTIPAEYGPVPEPTSAPLLLGGLVLATRLLACDPAATVGDVSSLLAPAHLPQCAPAS